MPFRSIIMIRLDYVDRDVDGSNATVGVAEAVVSIGNASAT